jgi:hypothetical protein
MSIIGISGRMGSGKDLSGRMIQYLTSEYQKHYTFEDWYDRVENYGSSPSSKYIIRKFADKLKDIVCILLSCSRKQLENQTFKDTVLGEEWWYYKLKTGVSGNYKLIAYTDIDYYFRSRADKKLCDERYLIKMTPRLLLQLLGTECGRDIIHPNIWCNSLMSEYKGFQHPQLAEVTIGPVVEFPNWVITDVRFPNEVKCIKDRGGVIIRVERDETNIPSKHLSETALDHYGDFDYVLYNNGSQKELLTKITSILYESN